VKLIKQSIKKSEAELAINVEFDKNSNFFLYNTQGSYSVTKGFLEFERQTNSLILKRSQVIKDYYRHKGMSSGYLTPEDYIGANVEITED